MKKQVAPGVFRRRKPQLLAEMVCGMHYEEAKALAAELSALAERGFSILEEFRLAAQAGKWRSD